MDWKVFNGAIQTFIARMCSPNYALAPWTVHATRGNYDLQDMYRTKPPTGMHCR